jgi:4-amino-4-deoxy-L-arabinose transferase-like glycosyltransferase
VEAQKTSLIATPPFTTAERALILGLFLVTFSLTLLTANDYGPTYDEPHYASAGARYADWWARVFRGDFRALSASEIETTWRLNHEHPPLQKVACGFAQRWFGGVMPGLMAMRLPSALWFAVAVCAIYLLCRGVWGRRGALFGALAFATMPRVIADAHFVALDMPIACWFFVTAAIAAWAMRRSSWPLAVLAGVAFGLALLAKLNAFFLPIVLIVWTAIFHRKQWPKLIPMIALGPLVFWIGWPWMWFDVVDHVRSYLTFHSGHAAYNVWYLGRLWQYAPWHYPFVMTAVTTPALLLALAALGIVGATRRVALACPPPKGESATRPYWYGAEPALLLLGLIVTLVPNALPSSPKYNGVRLFLPAFPFLAALAGGGFAWVQGVATSLASRLGRHLTPLPPSPSLERGRRLSSLIAAALGALLLYPGANAAIRIHPYQLAYYNALVGGTAGATRRGFETIYWGQVFEEAPLFLNRITTVSPRALVIPKGVIYLLDFQRQTGYLRPDVEFTGDDREAGRVDYVMFQAMQSDYPDLCWALVKGEAPAWTVQSEDGTPLLLIYDRAAVSRSLAAPPR